MSETNTDLAVIKSDLPTLSELYKSDNIDDYFKKDKFNLLMNQEPDPKWIQVNKYANNSKYIPIGIKETLLQRIFKDFRIEILREGTMFNAVYVTVRLHYLHPVTGEWAYFDGIGADQIQTKAGSSPADLQNIGNNAVAMSLPKAVSFAISDAADHLGRLFGRDLNRDKQMAFGVDKNLDTEAVRDEFIKLFDEKKELLSSDNVDNFNRIIEKEEKTNYKKAIDFLKKL